MPDEPQRHPSVLAEMSTVLAAMTDLRQYARHTTACWREMTSQGAPDCTCGFAEASSALDRAGEGLTEAIDRELAHA